jgi:hypothetical protein
MVENFRSLCEVLGEIFSMHWKHYGPAMVTQIYILPTLELEIWRVEVRGHHGGKKYARSHVNQQLRTVAECHPSYEGKHKLEDGGPDQLRA